MKYFLNDLVPMVTMLLLVVCNTHLMCRLGVASHGGQAHWFTMVSELNKQDPMGLLDPNDYILVIDFTDHIRET